MSQIGGRQTGKSQPQSTSGPELPEPKLKSIVKSVRLSLPKPAELESLGPAARSRYDTDPKEDRPRRERSRRRADTSVHPKDSPCSKSRSDKGSERSDRGTGRHDRKSGQSSSHKSKKDESLGAKLLARKEQEKWFKMIVENPALYIEDRSNKILPEEHEPEIEAMRFFGSGAERAAIDILAIIDWAAEYVKISNHPVPGHPIVPEETVCNGETGCTPHSGGSYGITHERNVCPYKGTEVVDLPLCLATILDRSGDDRVRKSSVWRASPARQPLDQTDPFRIEPEFRGTLQDHLGLHSRVHVLDAGPAVFWGR